MFLLLSVILDTLECASYFIHKLLEHLASGLLIEPEPSCDDVHLRDEAEDGVNVEIVECGQRIYLFPFSSASILSTIGMIFLI